MSDSLDITNAKIVLPESGVVPGTLVIREGRVAEIRQDAGGAGSRLTWEPAAGEEASLWVVQQRSGGQWKTDVLPGARREARLEDAAADRFAVRAVDRCGNASRPVVVSR